MPAEETKVVEIVVNGEPRRLPGSQSVSALLEALELDPSRVAVELDREILKKDRWSETLLEGGERLEIVQFVGGG